MGGTGSICLEFSQNLALCTFRLRHTTWIFQNGPSLQWWLFSQLLSFTLLEGEKNHQRRRPWRKHLRNLLNEIPIIKTNRTLPSMNGWPRNIEHQTTKTISSSAEKMFPYIHLFIFIFTSIRLCLIAIKYPVSFLANPYAKKVKAISFIFFHHIQNIELENLFTSDFVA